MSAQYAYGWVIVAKLWLGPDQKGIKGEPLWWTLSHIIAVREPDNYAVTCSAQNSKTRFTVQYITSGNSCYIYISKPVTSDQEISQEVTRGFMRV